MAAAGGVIYLLVMGLMLYSMYRRRRGQGPERDERTSNRWIVTGGIVMPAVVLLVVFGYTVRTLNALASPGLRPTDTIEIVGRQWWWEVRYPGQEIVTANEIHIPVGQPVQLKLTSADVIHSLWVPQLMGKLDLIPGKTNSVWIAADRPGEYLGECAEFCGTQHGKMRFVVIAHEVSEFSAWLENERRPAVAPENALQRAGQQVFLGSACVYCHRIAGTNATGNVGPDLTHLAGRRTLGAGIVPNVRGNLAGWIVNSQTIKPGNRMPPMYLEGEDLNALLAYLESLR
jgi:cytochrome c oxidase subunit 2